VVCRHKHGLLPTFLQAGTASHGRTGLRQGSGMDSPFISLRVDAATACHVLWRVRFVLHPWFRRGGATWQQWFNDVTAGRALDCADIRTRNARDISAVGNGTRGVVPYCGCGIAGAPIPPFRPLQQSVQFVTCSYPRTTKANAFCCGPHARSRVPGRH